MPHFSNYHKHIDAKASFRLKALFLKKDSTLETVKRRYSDEGETKKAVTTFIETPSLVKLEVYRDTGRYK